ncbi:MAG: hypothetical protein H6737_13665 [Alphaproteobacteria bacterium]|nr:hypothetical protein [Alphaproteobacteria bacterium]
MIALLAIAGCTQEIDGEKVRVTLDDTQVMVGEVWTESLMLDGALGTIAIPLEDVGEVVPVEGHDLHASNGHVSVWLRNGTELRGRWTEPELSMGISIGGEIVTVDLPMDQVERLQTPGAEKWPDTPVFRVKTTHGDDLLIDPESTQVTITNAMGTFSPFLSECTSLAPIGSPEGDWRIQLQSGTVLVGPLQHDTFELAMPMGPDSIEVPVKNVLSLTWQDWGSRSSYDQLAAPAQPAEEGWFSNRALSGAKSMH